MMSWGKTPYLVQFEQQPQYKVLSQYPLEYRDLRGLFTLLLLLFFLLLLIPITPSSFAKIKIILHLLSI